MIAREQVDIFQRPGRMVGLKPCNLEFEAVYEAYQPRIQRYLSRLVGEVEAEDLTQEVFVRVHRNLGAFRGESQLSTWLYRIATHATIDRSRTASFRAETSQTSLDEAGESHTADLWSGEEAPSLEKLLLQQQRFHCFLNFLNDLPEAYRIVFVLGELESLSNREIADILDLSLETVKIRLHRGRTRLFEKLRAFCKPEEWL